jgi:hypothetical protein
MDTEETLISENQRHRLPLGDILRFEKLRWRNAGGTPATTEEEVVCANSGNWC